MVGAIQTESANAGRAIAESGSRVQVGLERSRDAGAALAEIETTSREAGRRIEQIVAGVRAQASAADRVVASMDRVREGSASIDRAMEEQNRGNQLVLDAASGMRDLSAQLRRATSE